MHGGKSPMHFYNLFYIERRYTTLVKNNDDIIHLYDKLCEYVMTIYIFESQDKNIEEDYKAYMISVQKLNVSNECRICLTVTSENKTLYRFNINIDTNSGECYASYIGSLTNIIISQAWMHPCFRYRVHSAIDALEDFLMEDK